jgi:hypothetical protein
LPVPLREVVEISERANAVRGEPYLLVELGDGRQFALADIGVAFPPVMPNVPQAPEMPQVVCLRDFHTVHGQLEHMIYAHPEERPPREALDMVALALAILEGARHIGYDISDEERALEALLSEIERRR